MLVGEQMSVEDACWIQDEVVLYHEADTVVGVAAATAALHPAVDVIVTRLDPRSADRRDLVAANAYAGGHVVADAPCAADDTVWRLRLDGAVAAQGAPVDDAALDPITATMLVARKLARRGHVLRAGWTVLTGRLMPAVPVGRGTTMDVAVAGTHVLSLHLPHTDGAAA